MADHLIAVERSTGRRPPELNLPPLAPRAQVLWALYRAVRPSDRPLGWADLTAWMTISGDAVSEWEAETLLAIDHHAHLIWNQ